MQAKLANKKIIALTDLTEKSSIFGDANFLSLAACLRTATVLAANRPPPTLPPVRDASCGGGEAFPPSGASAVADSLQELSLSGVTPCPKFPPFTLLSDNGG